MREGVRLSAGHQVRYRGRIGEIRFAAHDVCLITYVDGTTEQSARAVLDQAYVDEELVLVDNATTIQPRPHLTMPQAKEVERRDAYLDALLAYPKPNAKGVREAVIAAVAEHIDDPHPPSPATLSRWLKERREAGGDNLQHIASRNQKRSRLDGEIEELMMKVIDDVWLKPNGPTMWHAYKVFKEYYHERGYDDKCPGYKAFCARIQRIPVLRRIECRDGKKEAEKQARLAGTEIAVSFPLERVEVDTAHVNLGLLNNDWHYVGIVTIYLVIDVYSRAILGYAIYVGKKRELPACAIHALRYAISPALFNLRVDWYPSRSPATA